MSGNGFLACIANEGYEVSLEVGKLYQRVSDPKAEDLGLVRVIDESGEDYLFPESYFKP